MPYQGDRVQEQPPKFTTDFAYLKKLPGALVLVQMVCSGLGFLLALGSSMVWNVKAGHGFFTFVSFMCFLSSICWLAVHVFQLYTLFKTTINWNKVGLVYNGVNTFLLMVASCFMVEVASRARVLRAAGVFGFFGFTGFLAGLVWEVLVWHKNRDGGPGFSTASVVRGPDRPGTPESDGQEEVAGCEQGSEAVVGLVSIKTRPVSSFLTEARHSGEVTTPMLTAPGWQQEASDSSRRSSTSSVEGQWHTPCPATPPH